MSISAYTERVGKVWDMGDTTYGKVTVQKRRQGEYWVRHNRILVGIYDTYERAEKTARFILEK